MANTFPDTAAAEMLNRIKVLEAQAQRMRTEAEHHDNEAKDLRDRATIAERMASEYRELLPTPT